MNNTCSQLAFLVKGLHDLQTDSTEIEAQLKEDLAHARRKLASSTDF